jgi:NADH-quinone oxidoreductase subunit M
MITLATFIPLLTAGLICLIPGAQRQLIRIVALLGTVATLIVTLGLVAGYLDSDAPNLVASLETVSQERLSKLGAEDRALVQKALDSERLEEADRKALEGKGLLREYEDLAELKLAAAAPSAKDLKFTEFARWIPAFRINYLMAIDGLSLPLVFLTALLSVLCVIYSWNIDKMTKGYMALFLLLETGMIGVFCALDFFLFYVFWEIVLLPMYFLIGIWGGPRRIYAAIKFFIYTLVGSVLMLLALLAMYFQTSPHTFNVLALMTQAPLFSLGFQWWIFLALFIAFAIKVPVFPFHTWLPDAHVEAPTAVSVVLAGVLLKMGGYGFFRFSYTLAPAAAVSETVVTGLIVLGLVNMVYGALCAMAQKDFKSLVAYSSISHMGFVLLGLASLTNAGVQGAALQMFTHGISSAMLFLLVGVIYERAHHRDLGRFGGIGLQMPYYTGIAMIGFFASLGLPGLSGFWGEAFVFLGAWNSWQSHLVNPGAGAPFVPDWAIYIGVVTIVLTAAYILWTIQRVYLGEIRDEHYRTFRDVGLREVLALAPLGILAVVVGVYPRVILDYLDVPMTTLINVVREGSKVAGLGGF